MGNRIRSATGPFAFCDVTDLGHRRRRPRTRQIGFHETNYATAIPTYASPSGIISSSIAAEPSPSITSTSASFEPVLNVPALFTFIFIAGVFGALIIRTNQVEAAVQERNLALEELRSCKARQLESNANEKENDGRDDDKNDAMAEDLKRCLQKYEDSCKREEQLRNVIPGVSAIRIVAPSGNRPEELQARADAKRFLGKDYDIGSTSSSLQPTPVEVEEANLQSSSPNRERGQVDDTNNSQLPIWPLAAVVVSQLTLIAFFTSLQDAAKSSPFGSM